jgi:hypothetical protein
MMCPEELQWWGLLPWEVGGRVGKVERRANSLRLYSHVDKLRLSFSQEEAIQSFEQGVAWLKLHFG